MALARVPRPHEIAVTRVSAAEGADAAVVVDAEGAGGAVAVVAAGDGAHAAGVVLALRATRFAVPIVIAGGADEGAAGADVGAVVGATGEERDEEKARSKRSHGDDLATVGKAISRLARREIQRATRAESSRQQP